MVILEPRWSFLIPNGYKPPKDPDGYCAVPVVILTPRDGDLDGPCSATNVCLKCTSSATNVFFKGLGFRV